MTLYVGSIAISSAWLFWGLSVLFFVSLLSVRANDGQPVGIRLLCISYGLLILLGVIGALLHAHAHGVYGAWATGAERRAFSWSHAGSLGAYAGLLVAFGLLTMLNRLDGKSLGWSLAAAAFAGGFVARMGCLFAGCCIPPPPYHDHPPFLSEIAAHWTSVDASLLLVGAVTSLAAWHARKIWLTVLTVAAYLGLRFGAEFLRPVNGAAWNLEQLILLAMIGILVGGAMMSMAMRKENPLSRWPMLSL